MIDIFSDNRIIMTLDAGGTNFVFNAMQAGKEILDPIGHPSNAHDLNLCLNTIIQGFEEVKEKLPEEPVAISFAFPGPADYPNGVIGDLPNLPAFKGGGIALGPMLEEKFKMPTFINNDTDMYVYGEALGGVLQDINKDLESAGNIKRYKNIFGHTLGTGYGLGVVLDGKLLLGDNAIASEVWTTRAGLNIELFADEEVSTRFVQRTYAKLANLDVKLVGMPKDIYDIAMGKCEGNKTAAIKAFELFGRTVGIKTAELITLYDGIVVFGGGLLGAKELFLPYIMEEINGTYKFHDGSTKPKLVQKVFNLDNPDEKAEFLKNETKVVDVPFSNKKVTYNSVPKVAVALTKLGASTAISIGAYAFALQQLSEG